jgi:peroxiredoxin
MRSTLLIIFAMMSLLLPLQRGFAQETTAASTELKDLMTKVQAKMDDGKKTEADMADELKEFDVLLAKHKGEQSDPAARILLAKAMLYVNLFGNADKGMELINQLKHDFPETKPGKSADKILELIKKQEEGKQINASLVEGTIFPGFNEKDVAGKPMSIARYKGKVVLVDFWATWCGAYVRELPNVLNTYEKHHGDGFEIVGISLDEDGTKMADFTKKKNMIWQQFFDGKGWGNKLAEKYGVSSLPATYLLDGEGKIIGKDLRGGDLEAAVTKALAKK